MDFKEEYAAQLSQIASIPERNRLRAERRFLLIKEFTDRYLKEYQKENGTASRKKEAMKGFCQQQGVALRTFYRWSREYRKHGIKGLVPTYPSKAPGETNPARKPFRLSLQVDPKNPLRCLKSLRDILQDHPNIPPENSKEAISFLDAELRMLKRRSGLRLDRELTEKEAADLAKYRNGTHKNHSAKATILLMANEGRSMAETMRASGRSHRTVYRCIQRFNQEGIDFIETNPAPEIRKETWRQRKIRLLDILHGSPRLYGLNRTTWTSKSIREAYRRVYDEELPRWALKGIIKEAGYRWKRAVKVLTSNDPEYKEKLAQLLVTLQTLKKDEVFFFIDEAGPWRVKRYGGKALTHKDAVRTIPEIQETKGAVNLIAALEATSNQVEWLFIGRKNASAVIKVLDEIKRKYSRAAKVYLTWDAVSAHRSSEVQEWIERTNLEAEQQKTSPAFEVVPLPSNAQWLNVVESTFSSLRRAVIHNSDYPSSKAMETAISAYFEERNAHFKENPRRAGKKIWEKEIFTLEELPGGLFRRM